MLLELRLRNFLLIEEASLSLAPGFTVFTGETGAGKSLLIKALRLVLGERADPGYIRPGAREAVVEALLVSSRLAGRLSDLGLEPAEEVLIRRVLTPERSRIFVNGTPVTLKMLSELTRGLVVLTGQHEFRALFAPDYRLRLLDEWAGVAEERRAYEKAFSTWRRLREEKASLEERLSQALRERDFLEFQIREIEEADLSPGEDQALLQERDLLRNLTRLKEGLAEGANLFQEAADLVARGLSRLRDLSGIARDLESLVNRLEGAYYEILEGARELTERLSGLPEDESRLEEVENRLARIERLKRKYGATVEEILNTLEELRIRRQELDLSGDRLEELSAREKACAEEALRLARGLSLKRREAARRLSELVTAELSDLALKGASFRVEVHSSEPRPENLTREGLDRVQFLVRTNPGTPERPLEKAASGGELSRIFLALKKVLSSESEGLCLVFDEVDAGIGGITAVRVGEKLRQLAQRDQVLCVTHLPQIAALADHHFCVTKEVQEGRTYTRVRLLSGPEREEELRRMRGETGA
ncbi:MAG TPA: DNA repair protein RecN [Thermosulfurimonas dismutans]|uniref:DNA repair protein RecN n=1 Tax=Thermosulfurimonas dismutans TaxID=999894 RepID=A0A7C3GUA0_9BACT|nr:DNA repair protein RecN [Thermosulfurimonas dismutans]